MLHERNDDFMNIGNIENLKQYKHIHLIGIGGVSMSGIAEVLIVLKVELLIDYLAMVFLFQLVIILI